MKSFLTNLTVGTAILLLSSLACSAEGLGIGVAIPDIMVNFVQPSYRSPEENSVRLRMAKKAIADAFYSGATHVNIFGPGYFPCHQLSLQQWKRNDLELWQVDPSAYWLRVDDMMNEISKYGMDIVVRGWNDLSIFPTLAGENYRDFITNPHSRSFQLYIKYWVEFLKRYQNLPQLKILGAPNELNLLADLDLVSRCNSANANDANKELICSVQGNYSTDEMIQFSQRVVVAFKAAHPNILLSSNYAIPRASAQHLRQRPEWSFWGANWTADSRDELKKYLNDVHAPYDLIDAHSYNSGTVPGKLDNQRLGLDPRDVNGTSLVGLISDFAAQSGKRLYVSEFGESYPDGRDSRKYTQNVMSTLISKKTWGGAIWGYEFYQFTTYSFQTESTMNYDLEQGSHDNLWTLMSSLNISAALMTARRPAIDVAAPVALITYPFSGSRINEETVIYVTAADDSGSINRVELLLDGRPWRILKAWPFKTSINGSDVGSGKHTLTAKTYDDSGNMSWDSIQIQN